MGAWIKSFSPLPTSHSSIAILRNQSLDPTMGLLSHLVPQWQALIVRLTSVASGIQGCAGPCVMQQVI